MNEKIDYKANLKHLYAPSGKDFSLVEALYSLSYGLKFMSKKQLGKDYVVPPLEGLWWAEDWRAFVEGDRDAWQWTMMILQPEWIGVEMVEAAAREAARKKDLPALPKARLETFHEGLAVQILHVGPYSAEAPTLRRLHEEYLPSQGLEPTGKHHEIYLSDPNRTAPEKLKTILRQPVRRR